MGEASKYPRKEPCKSPRSWLQMLRIVLVGCRSSYSCTDTPGCHRFQTHNANNVGEKILLLNKSGVC